MKIKITYLDKLENSPMHLGLCNGKPVIITGSIDMIPNPSDDITDRVKVSKMIDGLITEVVWKKCCRDTTKESSSTLKGLRIAVGLTQQQLADMIGQKRNALSQWETGARKPSPENVILLSTALNVSCDELMRIIYS